MADVTRSIEYVISAVDKASATMKKISGASLAMGTVITGALALAVKGAADAQKAQVQLEYATTKVAGATLEQADALSKLSEELERKGVIDGDTVKSGVAQLMTFGLSADMAGKLAGSLADLAVNQFGVNATQEQGTQTANMIAKALNGQFGVLEKSGIRFTEAQRHMIQFGNETERAAALQEGFAQNLKYTNESALQTMEGQLAQLNHSFGRITDQIGEVLIPILSELIAAVSPVIDIIVEWMQAHPQLTKVIVIVTAAIGALLVVLGGLGLVLGPIIAAFGAISTVITALGAVITVIGIPLLGAIGLAIGGVGFLIYEVVKHWEGLKWMTQNAISAILEFVGGWVDKFKGFMESVKSYLIDFILSPIETIRSAYESFFNWLKGMFSWLLGKSSEAQAAATPKSSRSSRSNRALGGTIGMDEPFTRVGETGPELVRLPAGSKVTPAHQSNSMRGGIELNITVQGSVIGLSPHELVQRLGAEIMRQINPTIAHA